ncbi:hypothetical protein A8H35_04955 [Burkholderia thailandensis]|nr:hypothetical protein A8H31_18315 [Burkholderia thailandensis]AWY57887.1 hypothetical protein A8H35_04955 [Burkholderia thailandensis]NOK42407.1 hypothetical protein [Burkholderia thailandensis]PHH36313.1 hypothetical protein CRX59_06020 [Burkholderia thailandensis]PNE69433.1 hypothetical protein A8H38_26245 [Burkholderia thailandensis]
MFWGGAAALSPLAVAYLRMHPRIRMHPPPRAARVRFLTRSLRLPPARPPRGGCFCAPLVSAIPASYTRA